MDWKEFFKPNKWKIILAIILLMIGFWIGLSIQTKYFCKCHDPPECTGCPKIPISSQIITMILLLPLILGSWFQEILSLTSILTQSIILILGIAYYYLISCILLHLYSKFKK